MIMCFACTVGHWPSCNNTVAGRKMRIVACLNRCNSKPTGAFNSIPVEMLKIPLAQWNYIDPTQATARLVIVPAKERY